MRVGVIHALVNATATTCYAASLLVRSRRASRGLRLAGLAALGAGGILGGHLSYRLAGGVNHAEAVPHLIEPGWHHLAVTADLPEGKPVRIPWARYRWSRCAPRGRCASSPIVAATCPARCRTAASPTAA